MWVGLVRVAGFDSGGSGWLVLESLPQAFAGGGMPVWLGVSLLGGASGGVGAGRRSGLTPGWRIGKVVEVAPSGGSGRV